VLRMKEYIRVIENRIDALNDAGQKMIGIVQDILNSTDNETAPVSILSDMHERLTLMSDITFLFMAVYFAITGEEYVSEDSQKTESIKKWLKENLGGKDE